MQQLGSWSSPEIEELQQNYPGEVYFHGTDMQTAKTIGEQGPRASQCGYHDFGHGFYTTSSLACALTAAHDRYCTTKAVATQNVGQRSRSFRESDPAVLCFVVSRSVLKERGLQGLHLKDDMWAKTVAESHRGNTTNCDLTDMCLEYDYVHGDLLGNSNGVDYNQAAQPMKVAGKSVQQTVFRKVRPGKNHALKVLHNSLRLVVRVNPNGDWGGSHTEKRRQSKPKRQSK